MCWLVDYESWTSLARYVGVWGGTGKNTTTKKRLIVGRVLSLFFWLYKKKREEQSSYKWLGRLLLWSIWQMVLETFHGLRKRQKLIIWKQQKLSIPEYSLFFLWLYSYNKHKEVSMSENKQKKKSKRKKNQINQYYGLSEENHKKHSNCKMQDLLLAL